MAKEIERKFLVTDTSYRGLSDSSVRIKQAYLSTSPDSTVRLRIAGQKAFITVKSRNHGATRNEWEYEIPVEDVEQMMLTCAASPIIEKVRYRVGRWEVNEFHGHLEGLVVAEIELESEGETFDKPTFIGPEVTGDPRYYNSSLSQASSAPVSTF